jgi:hypothetical protein
MKYSWLGRDHLLSRIAILEDDLIMQSFNHTEKHKILTEELDILRAQSVHQQTELAEQERYITHLENLLEFFIYSAPTKEHETSR